LLNQVARDNGENIDADKAAGRDIWECIEQHHGQNGDRAHPVDIWLILCQPQLPLYSRSMAKRNLATRAAYMSEVENWRELPDGVIEFTMRRLRTAD
jgi:hypothetical protein